MKRIFLVLCFIACAINIQAQASYSGDSEFIRLDLKDFDTIDVDAPIKLSIIKLAAGEKPYIEYNTHGYYTSKFTATVDDYKRELRITERTDSKRESVTEVKLYFSTLRNIKIARANVKVESTLNAQLLDLNISSDACFTANIDVLDFLVDISGKSQVIITGHTLYQTAEVATAQYDAVGLESVSTVVTTSHNAIAKVDSHERLEATTTTGGTIYYKTEPLILRTETSLFGGSISHL